MRVMLKFTMDTEASNKAIQDGSLPRIIQRLTEELKPEATYFVASGCGRREGLMFFDMTDSSQLPVIAEPLFMALRAEVTVTPVMNPADLEKGLQAAAAKR